MAHWGAARCSSLRRLAETPQPGVHVATSSPVLGGSPRTPSAPSSSPAQPLRPATLYPPPQAPRRAGRRAMADGGPGQLAGPDSVATLRADVQAVTEAAQPPDEAAVDALASRLGWPRRKRGRQHRFLIHRRLFSLFENPNVVSKSQPPTSSHIVLMLCCEISLALFDVPIEPREATHSHEANSPSPTPL